MLLPPVHPPPGSTAHHPFETFHGAGNPSCHISPCQPSSDWYSSAPTGTSTHGKGSRQSPSRRRSRLRVTATLVIEGETEIDTLGGDQRHQQSLGVKEADRQGPVTFLFETRARRLGDCAAGQPQDKGSHAQSPPPPPCLPCPCRITRTDHQRASTLPPPPPPLPAVTAAAAAAAAVAKVKGTNLDAAAFSTLQTRALA